MQSNYKEEEEESLNENIRMSHILVITRVNNQYQIMFRVKLVFYFNPPNPIFIHIIFNPCILAFILN